MNRIDPMGLLAETWTPLLLDLAVKGTLILVCAGVMSLLLRRSSAAARHLLWSLAMVSLLGLPVLAAALPTWHAPTKLGWAARLSPDMLDELALVQALLTQQELPPTPATAPALAPIQAAVLPVPDPPSLDVHTPSTPQTSIAPALGDLIVPVWAAGMLLAALRLALGWLCVWHLGRRSQRLMEGPAAMILEDARRETEVKRAVRLLQGTGCSMPMTWGIWRPAILLPDEAADWSRERLRAVLLHELAHVRRGDCLTQLVAYFAQALHWFNPLAWIALRQLRLEQERACDDFVVSAGMKATDYAVHLLSVAARLPAGVRGSAVALAMSTASRIEQRLVALFDTTLDHRPLRRTWGRLVSAAALAALLALASCGWPTSAAAELAQDVGAPPPAEKAPVSAKLLDELRAKVLERYVNPPDENAMIEGAIRGMLEALHDPYTNYLAPDKVAEMERQIRGTFAGIGTQLAIKDKRVRVVTPLQDSPALKAGVQAGDVILAIDDKPTSGLEIGAVVRRLMGPEGTTVKLKVQHPDGKEAELSVTRRSIKLESIRGLRRGNDTRWDFLLDPDHKIGYLQLTQLNALTPQEVRDAVRQLLQKGLNGLILDLRFCPGGLMPSAIEVVNLFLSKGTIVSTGSAREIEKTWKAEADKALGTFPIVVLVNEYTASAAEIVAGALKDNNRAILVGTRTYGKGSVQELIKLGDGSGALRLTTTYYFLPSGRNIHKRAGEKTWGVDPSDGYFVPQDRAQMQAMQKLRQEQEVIGKQGEARRPMEQVTPQLVEEKHADPQLAAALKTLIARLTTGSFVKIGRSNAALAAHFAQREEVRKRRAELVENLEKVDKELKDLEEAIKKAGQQDR